MKKRLVWWLLGGLATLIVLGLLIPGSPIQLAVWFTASPRYEGQTVGHWRQALNDPDVEVRCHAVHALGAIGDQTGEAVADVARVLRADPDANARNQAALALMKMAPASRTALPELIQALEDEQLLVRMNAALALRRLGLDARSAVPALIKGATKKEHQTNMRTFHFTIQEIMLLALGSASAGTAEGVPTLTDAVKSSPTDETVLAATRALGDVGPEARSAAPLLRPLLKHKMKELREGAAETLARIGADANPDPD